jgi:hypothetical protein
LKLKRCSEGESSKKTAKTEKIRSIEDLEEQVAQLKVEVAKGYSQGNKKSFQRGDSKFKNKKRKELICFHCQLPGHIRRYCPLKMMGMQMVPSNPNVPQLPSLTLPEQPQNQGNFSGQAYQAAMANLPRKK